MWMTPSLQSQNVHYAASVTSEIYLVGCPSVSPSSWPIVFPQCLERHPCISVSVILPAKRAHVWEWAFADMPFSVTKKTMRNLLLSWWNVAGEDNRGVCHRPECLAPMSSQLAPWHTTAWDRQVNKKTERKRDVTVNNPALLPK